MYENMTYTTILQQMLDRVPNSIDKREGSVIYDALAPAAAEMAQIYIDMGLNLNLSFASTSGGTYLALRAAEIGIERQQATKARRRGLFYGNDDMPIEVPLGSRFSIDRINYIVKEKRTDREYMMECETAGIIGNRPMGTMMPIQHIDGLNRAELADVIIAGTDEESDERLLERYQLRVRQPATSGNVYQYKQWALEVPGVGGAKVFPLWDGSGTVKLVIVDSDKQPASPQLVALTEQYINTVRPIGAAITVVSGVGKAIDVSATVNIASGFSLQAVVNSFNSVLTEHLKDIAFEATYVSYARIGTLLLSTPGVVDYADLILNGAGANIALTDEEMPTLGVIELGV